MSDFGGRDWSHIRRELTRRVTYRFPNAGHHNIEDAVATAVMNLFSVWKNYRITEQVTDPDKRFALAVWWGSHRAKQYLVQALRRNEYEVSFDRGVTNEPGDDTSLWDLFADEAPTPEEVVIANELARELNEAVEELRDEDLSGWVVPVMKGESIREQARREGRNFETIRERRHRGATRLRRALVAA